MTPCLEVYRQADFNTMNAYDLLEVFEDDYLSDSCDVDDMWVNFREFFLGAAAKYILSRVTSCRRCLYYGSPHQCSAVCGSGMLLTDGPSIQWPGVGTELHAIKPLQP